MLTQSVWKGLKSQYHTPIFHPHPVESPLLQLCKKVANVVKKCLVALCGVFALIATGGLLAMDVLLALFGNRFLEAKTVLDFYRGARNDKGYTLEDIWAFDDATLEAKHDFIQWLFPLKERGVNPTAPLTNDETIRAFEKDPELQNRLQKSFEVMLCFYGFEKKSDGSIRMGPSFEKQAQNWLHRGNHNYLRITRILHCLRLHGLKAEAKVFLTALETVYSRYSSQIGSKAIDFWRAA